MKICAFLLLITLSFTSIGQGINDSISNPNYDSVLAQKLSADDYGMKSYFLVVLTSGSNPTDDKELVGKSFRGHLDNIGRLVQEGKLIVAGPLERNPKNYRGLFIFNEIESEDDLKKLLQSDPAIKNGFLDFDIYKWYGSAALPEYLPFSEKIWKQKP
jgi:uncharacterized protein YciI